MKKRTDFKCTMQLMMQVAQRATFIIAKLHQGDHLLFCGTDSAE